MLLKDNKFSTQKIALIGVLATVAVITIYFESILPVNKLTLLTFSSFLVAIVVIEAGIKASYLFYVVTCLLIFIIIPKKTSLLPYALFFGYYAIFKYYAEKIQMLIPKMIIKQLFFNIVFYAIYLFLGNIFFPEVKFPFYFIAIALQFIFIIYDYVFTVFITFYNDKIRSKLKL